MLRGAHGTGMREAAAVVVAPTGAAVNRQFS